MSDEAKMFIASMIGLILAIGLIVAATVSDEQNKKKQHNMYIQAIVSKSPDRIVLPDSKDLEFFKSKGYKVEDTDGKLYYLKKSE